MDAPRVDVLVEVGEEETVREVVSREDVAVAAPRVVVVVAPVALTVRVCVRATPLVFTRDVTVVDGV